MSSETLSFSLSVLFSVRKTSGALIPGTPATGERSNATKDDRWNIESVLRINI